jgi:signal transduction histidine kinase
LINDILDLERMKSGKIAIRKSRCNVANLMVQATDVMKAMADQAQIRLVAEPLDVELWADSDRLLQTLTNLLSNAIKFSEPGKAVWMKATITDEAEPLNALSTPPSIPQTASLLITVRDQGRGIPANKLQTIFERFQQVDASDSRQKGGTGLGLAICRHIVEQHDGEIWVESVLGQGSTFYVLLPFTAAQPQSSTPL